MSQMATYDDANLLLKLYELRREEKLRAARDWFGSEFKVKTLEDVGKIAPPGSQNSLYFRMVTSYWDMVASFITTGVLNEDLFFESGYEMLGCWEKIREVTPAIREMFKNPLFCKNLEDACERYGRFLDRKSPGVHQAFQAYIRAEAG